MTKTTSLIFVNLATLKARAKHELLFKTPASILVQGFQCKEKSEAGLLNKSFRLAPALGVTKFIIVTDMILVTLCYAT